MFNMLNTEAKQKEQATENKGFIGLIGEKIEVTGTVKTKRNFGSYSYKGPSKYLFVVDTDRGQVKTFSTGKWIRNVKEGDKVSWIGTVKDHETFKGWKSTVLTRVKVI
jgi:hypothetical protein